MGRRIRKNVNGQSTGFFYTGVNATQELNGGSASANILNGGMDECFLRIDSGGNLVPITDALGSVLGLADANGNLVTQYSYDPFGNTSTSGALSANSSQYTGRENEMNGLYYYRARYYAPMLGRFISEDPVGFAGSGPNVYGYAWDDPIDFSDPFGLEGSDWDTVRDVANAAECFADALTFGSASRLNNALGAGGMVDRCGIGHKLGSAAGIVASIALGGALGAEAAEANAGVKGTQFSHWIPERAFVWVEENIGVNIGRGRGLLNGNYVSRIEHALNDSWAYRFMPKVWKVANEINPVWLQQWNRIPLLVKGAAVGAGVGEAGAMAGRSCSCK